MISQTPNPKSEIKGTKLLRTLVLCDLANSTEVVDSLGDNRSSEVMQIHDRLARDIFHAHNGQEIDKTDGFLLLFERPIQAIAFAIEYQRALKDLSESLKVDARARIGIHVGDVMMWENSASDIELGAKRYELGGINKPVAARLMALAMPGQILLTQVAWSLSQRALEELGKHAKQLQSISHGKYCFKGVEGASEVYELGEKDVAPLQAPPSGGKAWKDTKWWLQPKLVAAEILLLLIGIAVAVVFTIRSEPSLSFESRDWVVIGNISNSTGQYVFHDALETAFRLSIEQSKYVNVVSNLQVRNALELMKLNPDIPIGRENGSEIALREGARALILPRVDEYGGKLRVTAEIVDPRTQSTVLAEVIDADGADKTIEAVDEVAQRLRAKLGEAVSAIEKDSLPLSRVATSNMEALRSYSLAERSFFAGKYTEARQQFEQTTLIDPEFALAYVGIARVYLAQNKRESARKHFEKAHLLQDRMSPRERLYLNAMIAGLDGSTETLVLQWKTLGDLYPDHHPAQYNFALWAHEIDYESDEALKRARAATAQQNPGRASAMYLMGRIQLKKNNIEQAKKLLEDTKSINGGRNLLRMASIEAVQRNFLQAESNLENYSFSGVKYGDFDWRTFTVALQADQGRLASALEKTIAATDVARTDNPLYVNVFGTIELGLQELQNAHSDQVKALAEKHLNMELSLLKTAQGSDVNSVLMACLFSAKILAKHGDWQQAQSSVELITEKIVQKNYPPLSSMLEITQAEILLAQHFGQKALIKIKNLQQSRNPYLSHELLMRVYIELDQPAQALAQADWLAENRGVAWEEDAGNGMFLPYQVAHSSIALLSAAEIALKMGEIETAKRRQNEFTAAWPQLDPESSWTKRLNALSLSPR